MRRYVSVLSLLALVTIAFPSFAICDVVKLKSGQTYKGSVTAEEKDRVQVKLEDTGTRIWFSRDQIESLEKSATKEEPKPKDQSEKDKQAASPDATQDDVSRARELLKKMREQQSEEAANKKKDNHLAVSPASSEQDTAVAPPPAEGSEIEKLIDTFKNGQYYDRLKACKRLGDLKAKEAIPHMIHYLDDENFSIRQAANQTLVQITGQDFGFNPKDRGSVRAEVIEKWKGWYDEQKKKKASSQLKSFW